MTAFTGALALCNPDADLRRWTLLHDFSFGDVTVPAGFSSDGASIPRPLWWLEPPWGRAGRAALVHDYLYARRRAGDPHPVAPTLRSADAVFHAALIASGVSRPLAWLMWAAVRVFGRRHGSLVITGRVSYLGSSPLLSDRKN